jgi:O-6-methylguanine DNA methyltransferase
VKESRDISIDIVEKTGDAERARNVTVRVTGTPFQVAVWSALAEIPSGETVTYSDIAARVGHPRAVRAVGSAVSANPYPVLIPCHRVVPKGGGIGNYLYGAERKRELLELEGVLDANGALMAKGAVDAGGALTAKGAKI